MDYVDERCDDDTNDQTSTNYLIDLKSLMINYQLDIRRWCGIRNIDPNEFLSPSRNVPVRTKLEFSVDGYHEVFKKYLEFTLYRGSKFNKVSYPDIYEVIKLIHPWLTLPGYEMYRDNLASLLYNHYTVIESKLAFKANYKDNRYNLWYYTILGNRCAITNGGDVRLLELDKGQLNEHENS